MRRGTCMVLALAACALPMARGARAQNGQSSPTPPASVADSAPPATAAGAPALPGFEVVSIKPHKDEGMMMRMGMSVFPDGFQADGVSLQMLVRQAFGFPDDRILNEPDWTKSARFDVNAKVAPEDAPQLKALTTQERSAMLLPVLGDRFGLKYHHETRVLQVYTLVLAKGGPKLKESTLPDSGANALPPPPIPPGASGAPGGAAAIGQQGRPVTLMRMSRQGMTLEAHGATTSSLVRLISQQIGGTVEDKTGLTAKYDFTLSFMPDSGGMGPMGMRAPGSEPPPDGAQSQEPVGPSLFTAVQEQLGLKLETKKEAMDVIVIDQITQPTEN